MRHSVRKARLACMVFVFVLIITAGVALARDHQLYSGVLPVAGQASSAPANQVTNNVTVSSDVISLGSTLQANGQVSTASGPLANAPVALHIGDIVVAHAQTDQRGQYAFAVPVGVNYFPAAFSNGATIYTVVEPRDSSFISTPSAVTGLPVDLLPLFIIILVVTGAIVLGLYVYARRLRAKASSAAPVGKPSKRSEKPIGAAEKTAEGAPPQGHESVDAPPAKPTPVAEITEEASPPVPEPERDLPPKPTGDVAAAKEARELFERGDDRQAIGVLYDAAFASLATRAAVTLAPDMTHWERYGAIEAAIPEVREPLRTLTVAFERTHYGGKSLTKEHQNAAIAAFQSIVR